MKISSLSLMTIILTSAFVTAAIAADEKKSETPQKRQFTGIIESNDPTTKTLTVKNAKGERRTFSCTDKCKYATVNQPAAEATDIKVGDKVTCYYTEEDGKYRCHKCAPAESMKKTAGATTENK
jgi:hypothetical protein